MFLQSGSPAGADRPDGCLYVYKERLWFQCIGVNALASTHPVRRCAWTCPLSGKPQRGRGEKGKLKKTFPLFA